MYCSNCGAEISEHEAYCPYCGVMNPHAAEREYMEKLEDIREDTEKLGEETGHQTRRGIRRAGKLAVRAFIIVAAIIAGLFVLSRVMDRQFMRGRSTEVRSEAAFKEEYFPKLDAIYEAGDDEATADYMNEIGGYAGSSIMNRWKHYSYMNYYMDYSVISMIPKRQLGDDFWQTDYPFVLYSAIELIYQTDTSARVGMSDEESEKVRGYAREAEEICAGYFSLSKSDLDEIYESSIDDGGYLYSSRVSEWAEKTGGNRK